MAACGDSEEDTNASSENTETVTVEHELDTTEVPKNPESIIVFDFGILDTLDYLEIDVAGVPQAGTIPSYLDQYASDDYENIGSLKEPDFEKISEIDPDLIIISGRQADLYDQLTELAPTIHLAVDTTDYMNSFKSNMEIVGEIFDKEAEVEEELNNIDEMIADLNERAQDSDEEALIILANDDKISAYGPNSRFGLIHDVFGLTPTDEGIEASTHGMNVSFEYVMEENPDILYVVDRGAVVGGAASDNVVQLVENELVENTSAYQNDNIYYLNPEFWYLSGGGLVSVSEMVKEISETIE
jgi:iron complex transport system substrate-binding protein